jgi:hypothetical protein
MHNLVVCGVVKYENIMYNLVVLHNMRTVCVSL